jgi:hypothetical protein
MGLVGRSEPTTLTVFRPLFFEEGAPLVREALWRRSEDLDRLFEEIREAKEVVAFRPTITVRDAPVPYERFSLLMKEASSFHLPVVWSGDRAALTTDAGTIGFEVFGDSQPPAIISVEWSVDRPASWEPMIAWHAEVRRFLEACFTTEGSASSPMGIKPHPLWDQEMDGGMFGDG